MLNNRDNKESCNLLLETEGTFPYYYIYNDKTKIIKLTHIQSESGNGIRISSDDPLDDTIFDSTLKDYDFKCGDEANFDEKTVTYYDTYKIEFPLNRTEKIILKSMIDIFNDNEYYTNVKKANEVDFVLEETLKIAKPIQV